MNLEVHNKRLEKILSDPNKLIKKVGLEMAQMIKKRFDELIAFPNFKTYLECGLGKPHLLTGNLNKLYSINLNKNYRLIVEPLVEEVNDINLKECKNINIKGVVDYHEEKINWLIP